MTSETIQRYGKLKFASFGMGAVSGKTFQEVFEKNKEFVEFTVNNMTHGTGIFKFWIAFVKEQRSKHA